MGIVVFDGVKLLDVAGPSEVLTEANEFGADYELVLLSADGRPVRSSTGMGIEVDAAFTDPGLDLHTLVVAGGDRLPTRPIEPELLDGVRRLAHTAERVCAVCTGAFVLAATGLLSGRRVTTHWRHACRLARAYPRLTVEPDAIYVSDGKVLTSAGVSAGVDLTLAVVEHDAGGEVARAVAQSLVVFLQRPGGQSQFSPALQVARPRNEIVRELVDHITANPAEDHSATALAARANVSVRHLSRLFVDELGLTPARFVETVRIDAAKRALVRGETVATAARQAGFGTPESLRRAFVIGLGVSPREYRSRFSATSPGLRGQPPSSVRSSSRLRRGTAEGGRAGR